MLQQRVDQLCRGGTGCSPPRAPPAARRRPAPAQVRRPPAGSEPAAPAGPVRRAAASARQSGAVPAQRGSSAAGGCAASPAGPLGRRDLRRGVASQLAIPAVERRAYPPAARRSRVPPAGTSTHRPAPRRGLPAADHQPVLGAGQRDVEQPVVLLHPPLRRRIAQALGGGAAQLPPRRPDRHVAAGGRIGRPQDRALVRRQRRGVRQDHQRRLQSLGAVHRHHPHQAAGAFRLALHLRAGAAQPVQEALQRRRMHAAVGQRRVQQFVHRFGRLRARAARTAAPGRRAARAPRRTARAARRNRRARARRRRTPRPPASPAVRSARVAQRVPQRPRRPIASSIRLSSDRPPSGLVSRQAKVRSSCGSSSASASAIRSCTAGCSVSISRSSPATGTPRDFSARTRARPKSFRAAHQHHHVARARAAAPCSPASRRRRPRGRSSAPASRPGAAAPRSGRWFCSGTVQGCGSVGVGHRRERPQLHRAGMVGAVGVVGQRLARLDDAGGRGRIGEHAIHQLQHRPRGAERHVELCVAPGLACRAATRSRSSRCERSNSSMSAPWNE